MMTAWEKVAGRKFPLGKYEAEWERVNGLKFELSEYLDENQRLRPEYHL